VALLHLRNEVQTAISRASAHRSDFDSMLHEQVRASICERATQTTHLQADFDGHDTTNDDCSNMFGPRLSDNVTPAFHS
jgi:hypothetical protein